MPQVVSEYLREAAVRCERLARKCPHERTKEDLEKLSLDLAEKAIELNADFTAPTTVLKKASLTQQWIRRHFTSLEASLIIVVLTTIILLILDIWFEAEHLVFGYLAPILFIANRYGSKPAIMASMASVLSAVYFFYPPKFSIYVVETQYFIELIFFSAIALLAIQFITERILNIQANVPPSEQ